MSQRLTKPPIKFKDCLHLVILKEDAPEESYYCCGCHTKASVTLLRTGRQRFSMKGFGEDAMFTK